MIPGTISSRRGSSGSMPRNDEGGKRLRHMLPSSPRNGFAVIAGGAALLRGVSKDGCNTIRFSILRDARRCAPPDEVSLLFSKGFQKK
jgi:hypothetical protein